jgi:hypothetical protein
MSIIVYEQKRGRGGLILAPVSRARCPATCFLILLRWMMSGQAVGKVSSVAPSYYPR